MPIQYVKDKKVKRASAIFTDRKEPRKAFWDNYDHMRKLMSHDEFEIKVITYYGIGGIGKSTLLKKIEEELDNRIADSNAKYIHFDFNSKQEPKDILLSLRKLLLDNKSVKFSFPLFDFAYCKYSEMAGESPIENNDKVGSFDTPLVSFVSSALAIAPEFKFISVLSNFSDFLEKVSMLTDLSKSTIDFYNSFNKERGDEIEEINQLANADELLKLLPKYFALDLDKNLEGVRVPLVILLDTYEKLVNDLESGSQYLKDEWLKNEEYGLIPNIKNALWVIAGRERIKWEEYNPNWNGTLEQHLLGDLSDVDVFSFLSENKIINKELQKHIYNITNGIPVYLDICVNTYNNVKSQGKAPSEDDFGKNTEELAERYLRYMTDTQKSVMSCLSCLDFWNDELIIYLSKKVSNMFSISVYDSIIEMSLINKINDNYFKMHQVVRNVFYCKFKEERKTVVLKEASQYYESKLENSNAISDMYVSLLKEYIRINSILLEGNDMLNFIKQNYSYIRKLNASYLFDSSISIIDEAISNINDKQCQAILLDYKARTLNLSGKYKTAYETIKLAIEIYENNNIDGIDFLDAKETLSDSIKNHKYDYFESFKIEKEVYEKKTVLLQESDRSYIETLSNYSSCLYSIGLFTESLELDELLLKLVKKYYSEDKELLLKSLRFYAASLRQFDRYKEAHSIFMDIYNESSLIFGEIHRITLSALNNIIMSFSDLGDYKASLKYAKKLYSINKNILGENHPETLRSLNELSICLHDNGYIEEYEKTKKIVFDKRKKALGDEHSLTMASAYSYADSSIGSITLSIDDFEEDIKMEEGIVNYYLNNIDTLSVEHYHTFCNALESLGKNEKCKEARKRQLSLYLATYGEKSIYTQKCKIDNAKLCMKMNDMDNAIKLLNCVITDVSKIFSKHHHIVSNAKFYMSECYRRMEMFEEAAKYAKDVRENYSLVFDENHPEARKSFFYYVGILKHIDLDYALSLVEKDCEARKHVSNKYDIYILNDLKYLIDYHNRVIKKSKGIKNNEYLIKYVDDIYNYCESLPWNCDNWEEMFSESMLKIVVNIFADRDYLIDDIKRRNILGKLYPICIFYEGNSGPYTLRVVRATFIAIYNIDGKEEAKKYLTEHYNVRKESISEYADEMFKKLFKKLES